MPLPSPLPWSQVTDRTTFERMILILSCLNDHLPDSYFQVGWGGPRCASVRAQCCLLVRRLRACVHERAWCKHVCSWDAWCLDGVPRGSGA